MIEWNYCLHYLTINWFVFRSKALSRLGEKATIESTINKIEELLNKTSDDETEDKTDTKNGDKTGDETKTEDPNPNGSEVIDEKERERKLLEYEEKIKQRRLEREGYYPLIDIWKNVLNSVLS